MNPAQRAGDREGDSSVREATEKSLAAPEMCGYGGTLQYRVLTEYGIETAICKSVRALHSVNGADGADVPLQEALKFADAKYRWPHQLPCRDRHRLK
jgi:hypothetical protein